MNQFQQIEAQIAALKQSIAGNVSSQFRQDVTAAIAALEKIKVYF